MKDTEVECKRNRQIQAASGEIEKAKKGETGQLGRIGEVNSGRHFGCLISNSL